MEETICAENDIAFDASVSEIPKADKSPSLSVQHTVFAILHDFLLRMVARIATIIQCRSRSTTRQSAS